MNQVIECSINLTSHQKVKHVGVIPFLAQEQMKHMARQLQIKS